MRKILPSLLYGRDDPGREWELIVDWEQGTIMQGVRSTVRRTPFLFSGESYRPPY